MAGVIVVLATPSSASAAGLLWLRENRDGSGAQCGYGESKSNLNDGSGACHFGDKASVATNNSDVAWVLYDDAGYGDTRWCIRPGKNVDLHDYGFGDKISSVKKLSTASCTGYTNVF